VVRPYEEVKSEIKNYLFALRRQPEMDRFISQLKEDAWIQKFPELGIIK
jgi:hypothetical protein